MATLYFFATVSGYEEVWNGSGGSDFGNWYTDHSYVSGTDTPATALPLASDDIYILTDLLDLGGATRTCVNATLDNVTISDGSYGLVCTLATFYNTSYNDTYITGNVIFNGNSNNNAGSVEGNVTFNDYAYHNSGTITGDATFNGSSYNEGTVDGSATFNIYSENRDNVTGNCTFNNDAYNMAGGLVYGNATFNNYTSNYAGTVNVDAEFNNGSSNQSTVSGDAIFNDYTYNTGTVYGSATFNDSSGFWEAGSVSGTLTFGNVNAVTNSFNNATGLSATSFIPALDVIGTGLL